MYSLKYLQDVFGKEIQHDKYIDFIFLSADNSLNSPEYKIKLHL